ncbi:hypothetical protein NIES970_01790 [[Synechococcus] sp. NIES-970]|uniref:hypothetical protein n=1 Tax=Picosynechococcus sp. NKBG15041c TaxID=1407650 RepID=UPI00042664EF|nr:hypothetical protein [Picosynechococcus sp. NKBG15041c]BAW95277.1 hypothetical protein NIES970_01790 [[Synechococcus] sp. NIES-970]
MTIQRQIDWQKLAEIHELKEFFAADFRGFQGEITQQLQGLDQFPPATLEKLAKLRALEVTNGITQWAYRRGADQALSIEQTRQCMNMVMGFMKNVELTFPSIGTIAFSDWEKDYVRRVRGLYIDAFKNNVPGAELAFHAISTAQFIACGQQRLNGAIALVEQDYGELFSSYFIERMKKYIGAYLDSFSESP